MRIIKVFYFCQVLAFSGQQKSTTLHAGVLLAKN
jgi:hypothetical protein